MSGGFSAQKRPFRFAGGRFPLSLFFENRKKKKLPAERKTPPAKGRRPRYYKEKTNQTRKKYAIFPRPCAKR
ncbi:MAG: hypothetical protein II192_07295, partial [Clostridia bacterium]|nr:hypothetical protein [Clostridia bacterium]